MKGLDCNEVLERLWAYLDGEADEAQGQELQDHIARCLGCRQHADFEAKLRQVIQAKCCTDRAPRRLREELHRLLSKP